MQPLQKEEVTALTKWLHERNSINHDHLVNNPWLFISRMGKPLSRQRVYNILAAAGESAGLDIKVHPHMLRHACGYALADNGVDTRLIQDYLGHRNIRHTVIYTASNSMRFEKIWKQRKTKKLHFDPFCKPVPTSRPPLLFAQQNEVEGGDNRNLLHGVNNDNKKYFYYSSH